MEERELNGGQGEVEAKEEERREERGREGEQEVRGGRE